MTHPGDPDDFDDFDDGLTGERTGCGRVMLATLIFYAILFGVFYLVWSR